MSTSREEINVVVLLKTSSSKAKTKTKQRNPIKQDTNSLIINSLEQIQN